MRPRDILNRRKKYYFFIVAISFAVLAIVAFIEKYLPTSLSNTITAGAGIVFLVGILLVYAGITCPKCHKILGLKYVYAEETLTRCPNCKINFDEDSL
jgi:xanthine/uracil/vitamin C permease (AzgA family)